MLPPTTTPNVLFFLAGFNQFELALETIDIHTAGPELCSALFREKVLGSVPD